MGGSISTLWIEIPPRELHQQPATVSVCCTPGSAGELYESVFSRVDGVAAVIFVQPAFGFAGPVFDLRCCSVTDVSGGALCISLELA